MVSPHQRAGSRPQRTAAFGRAPKFLELLNRLFQLPRETAHCRGEKRWRIRVHVLVREQQDLILRAEFLGKVHNNIKKQNACDEQRHLGLPTDFSSVPVYRQACTEEITTGIRTDTGGHPSFCQAAAL